MKYLEFYKDSFKGLSKDVWSLSLIYLVNRSGEMVIPFMSVYLTQQLGFSKTQTAAVLFCFGLGALAGSNIGGYLSDTIGNFKVMAISLFGTGITFMSLIFIESFYIFSAWLFITAVFSSMFSPAAFSAVSFWGIPENKTRGYSLLRMAINLGVAIGPAVGGILAKKSGYHWLFILDGLTCFLALGVLFLVLGHRNIKREVIKEKNVIKESPFKDIPLMLFLLFNLLNMTFFFQILFSVPVYFKEVVIMDELLIGIFFTANGLLVFILEMPLVYIIEKSNKYFKPMVMGAFLIGLGYISLSIFKNPLMAIVMYSLLVALGEVINFPLIPSLAMRRADEQNHGKYMGVVSMMFAMSFLLAPIAGLPIIEKIGYISYWTAAGVCCMIAGVFLWLLRSSFKEKEKIGLINK